MGSVIQRSHGRQHLTANPTARLAIGPAPFKNPHPDSDIAHMAVQCPCGCGSEIRRISKRTAERAVFVTSLAQLPEHLAEVQRFSEPVSAYRLDEFAAVGRSYSAAILGAVHGIAHQALPTAKALGDWEAAALKLMRAAELSDPHWYAQWRGPVRNRLTNKGRK